MKKLIALALLFAALSSLGHFYLAKRAYQLQVGEAAPSNFCNIGENLNCDSALLSAYAKIFEISISNFGLGFNIVLSGLLLFFFLFGVNVYWKNISFYLSGVIALSSLVMAVISLLNDLYCPICWTLYFLSFFIPAILYFSFKKELSKPFPFVLSSIKQKSFYILGGCILGVSLFFHINFITVFDIKSQQESLEAILIDWQNEKTTKLQATFLLQRGTEDSKMVIVEFVDFLCPACKRVQPALKQFLNHFPEVEFQFYAYPSDGACNPSISYVHSGLSCELSKAIVCGKKQNKGWLLHDSIFEKQNRFLESRGDKEKTNNLFEKMIAQVGINKEEFELCMKDPDTLKKIKQSSQAAGENNIQGTPTFFINGKKIRHHSSKLLILKKVYDHL